MRDLKFRAWDSYTEKMLPWEVCCEPINLTLSNLLNGFIDHIKPMQYTGLNKNGKEVYEGDVFVINKDDDEWNAVVEWDDKRARFEFKTFHNPVTDISFLDAVKSDNCEIIGNIYDP